MAESIDFQFPMKKACGAAIKQFCSSVPHNHARVIRCLQVSLPMNDRTPILQGPSLGCGAGRRGLHQLPSCSLCFARRIAASLRFLHLSH